MDKAKTIKKQREARKIRWNQRLCTSCQPST